MSAWINFLAYQCTWFIVVSSAAHRQTLVGLGVALLFSLAQLAVSKWRKIDAQLMGVALALGTLIDGALSYLGWIRYADAAPALPPGGAPLWILALWVGFALTFTRSLAWLQGRPLLGMLLGAIGAPLSYWSAAREWHAVRFLQPEGFAGLAVGWALAIPLLLHLARRAGSARAAPVPHCQAAQ